MESLGTYLKQNREAKGITLEHIAGITKIPQSSLRYLEEGELERLPSPVFVRGFIRACCQVLQIEAGHALALYHTEETAQAATKPRVQGGFDDRVFRDTPQDTRDNPGLRLSHLLLILIAVVTFIIAFMTVGSERNTTSLSSKQIINQIDQNQPRSRLAP